MGQGRFSELCWSHNGVSLRYCLDGKLFISDASGSLSEASLHESANSHLCWLSPSGFVVIAEADQIRIAKRDCTICAELPPTPANADVRDAIPAQLSDRFAVVSEGCVGVFEFAGSAILVLGLTPCSAMSCAFSCDASMLAVVDEARVLSLFTLSENSLDYFAGMDLGCDRTPTKIIWSSAGASLFVVSNANCEDVHLTRFAISTLHDCHEELRQTTVLKLPHTSHHTISHGGNSILAIKRNDFDSCLIEVCIATGAAKPITPNQLKVASFQRPSRAPDVFVTGSLDGAPLQLFRITPAQELVHITHAGKLQEVAVAPDGESLAFLVQTDSGGSKLIRMDGPRMQSVAETD